MYFASHTDAAESASTKREICEPFMDGLCPKSAEACDRTHSRAMMKAMGDLIPPPSQSRFPVPTQACYAHFADGRCSRKAGACDFSHSAEAVQHTHCKHYLHGNCPLKHPKRCPMIHDPEMRRRVACQHYLSGACKYEERCVRSHDGEKLKVLCPNAYRYGNGAPAIVTCPVCLDTIRPNATNRGAAGDEEAEAQLPFTLPCKHMLHKGCADGVKNFDSLCPLCRKPF